MPLLRKQKFVRRAAPGPGSGAGAIGLDEEVFLCEATREVFRDYEEFFQRTILCNSLVWSCAVTGRANLTYEEARESERRARKRLGGIPAPLRRGLLYLADRDAANKARLSDLVDDVYVFSSARFFRGELVEAVVNNQWCDCRIVDVVPPSQADVDADAVNDSNSNEDGCKSGGGNSNKKSFFPPEHLFKYVVEEVEPDEAEEGTSPAKSTTPTVVDAEDVRREKGLYTREKNLLFLKNIVDLGPDGHFRIKPKVAEKYRVSEIEFDQVFAGPPPVFDITSKKPASSSSRQNGEAVTSAGAAAKKKQRNKKGHQSASSGKGQQGTLDNWVKGGSSSANVKKPGNDVKKSRGDATAAAAKKSTAAVAVKKMSPEEVEEEMRRVREQNERFKAEMRRRAEENKKRRLEEKAREKERKKEEKRLLAEVLAESRKPREDLECGDLRQLPRPHPVRCRRLPNCLFGDFLSLLEFFGGFADILETLDSFPNGVTFELLEEALVRTDHVGGPLYDLISFMLGAFSDLQQEEDEEVKLDKLSVADCDVNDLDRGLLGKDEDLANQIKYATAMARWPIRFQGQSLFDLHVDEWSITEILRLHLASSGAFRSDKLTNWQYQQRGGYRLSDDPGLQLRMREPQILEGLTSKTVYELSAEEKVKILTCLMHQLLSFATVRDEIDDKFNELQEAKMELRSHQISENKRQRQLEEAGRQKRREEKLQKVVVVTSAAAAVVEEQQLEQPSTTSSTAANLTERQRLAIQAQKEKDEKEQLRKEGLLKLQALDTERALAERVSQLQVKAGRTFIGRDRAYRRYWILESVPGLFVEHDDDHVGGCLPDPTPSEDHEAGPLDESAALIRVKKIMEERAKVSVEKSPSSDKENEEKPSSAGSKSKLPLKDNNGNKTINASFKQKVLVAKNLMEGEESGDVKVKVEEGGEASSRSPPWGICLANPEVCTVHSTILPKTNWSYFGSMDEVDSLVDNLNQRGFREGELRERLLAERELLAKNLRKMSRVERHLSTPADDGDCGFQSARGDQISVRADLTLRDQILEMEDKVFVGTLGSLKVRGRLAWQEALRDGGYDPQCDSLTWGKASAKGSLQSEAPSRDPSRPGSPSRSRHQSPPPSTESSSPLEVAKDNRQGAGKVRQLASAILQVAQMVDPKYLKRPLGEDEKDKKKRLKEEDRRKKNAEIEDSPEVDGMVGGDDDGLAHFHDWENSLMASTSCAQLFIHLTTLESSIMWSKSLLNTKCRICRRKNEPDKMLLCDGCDRGHHMYCLKPKLKSIPSGDWYCNECKPKMRVRSPKKKTRQVFAEVDDDENEDDDYSDEKDDSEDSDDGASDNEDATASFKTGKAGNSDDHQVGGEEDDSDEDHEVVLAISNGLKRSCNDAQSADDATEDDDDDDDESGSDNVREENSSPPRRRKRPVRETESLPKKKSKAKKDIAEDEDEEAAPLRRVGTRGSSKAPKNIGGLSRLLIGQRRTAATEASAKRESNRLRLRGSAPSSGAGSRSSGEASSTSSNARSKRRRAVDDDLEGMFNPTVLEDLLNAMMRHKDGWPFDRPITKAEAPDYHQIIKKPMDLGTIRSGLNRMKYRCNQEVLEDIRLVFSNCWAYNRTDAEEYQCGVRLEAFFLKQANRLGLGPIDQSRPAGEGKQSSLGSRRRDSEDDEDDDSSSSDEDEEDRPVLTKRSRRTF